VLITLALALSVLRARRSIEADITLSDGECAA
jgi:hypothetical protein